MGAECEEGLHGVLGIIDKCTAGRSVMQMNRMRQEGGGLEGRRKMGGRGTARKTHEGGGQVEKRETAG